MKPGERDHASDDASRHDGDASTRKSAAPDTWYYLHRGVSYGPICRADLRAAAHLGFIKRDDLVHRADSLQWTPAGLLHWLFADDDTAS
ncbi:MAG: DUF4339 domain-containing protein [Planctomycetaceae bacterium]